MASLLSQLAKGMIFAHRNFNELSRKRTKKKERRRCSKLCLYKNSIFYYLIILVPDGKFMFARLPPDPPRESQVVLFKRTNKNPNT